MHLEQAPETQLPRDQAESLAELLSSYLRASFTYPANNHRVVEQRSAVREALEALDEPRIVHLVLDEHSLRLGGCSLPEDEGPNDWLRNCMLRAALGKVVLSGGADEATLQRFAEHLRNAFAHRPRSFEEFWIVKMPGLAFGPLEMLVLLQARDQEDGGPGEAGDATADSPLRRLLAEDEELHTRLVALRDELKGLAQPSERGARLDLLEWIQEALPAEARSDDNLARALVGQVLDACQNQLGQVARGGPRPPVDLVQKRAVQVGLRLFRAHRTKLDSDRTSDLPEGRAGDERITDDLDLMLQEFEQLPSDPTLAQRFRQLQPPDAELFDVFALGLRRADRPSTRNRAANALSSLLEASPELFRSLLPSVDRCFDGEVQDESDWRILEFVLQRADEAEWALPDWRDVAFLDSVFPHLFGHLLETATTDDVARDRLGSLVGQLDPARIRAAREALVTEHQITSPERWPVLFDLQGDGVLPLLWLLCEERPEEVAPKLALRLRQRKLPMSALAALQGADPGTQFESRYLELLCERDLSEEHLAELAELSSAALRVALDACVVSGEAADRRGVLVRLIQTHACEENLAVLERLARSTGSFLAGRSDKNVHRQAKDAAKEMRARLRAERKRRGP